MLIEQLVNAIGEKNVLHGEQVKQQVNGFLDPSPSKAKAIVFPKSTEDVSSVMKICYQLKQPVVIQGGKSGSVKGHIPKSNEVAVCFEKMTAIEEIDTIGRTATVQAGCILQTLQDEVEKYDLAFQLDLGGRGSCTIGGNLSTNAGGIRVIRYGMMREQVLGLEVVMADGTIVSSMNSVIKNNTGYDLKQLFIGAEGTLGVVTRIVVRLRQKMLTSNVALIAMNSFDQVLTALQAADAGLSGQMTAYELMSKEFYQINANHLGIKPIADTSNYYVVIETQGSEEVHDLEKFENVLTDMYEKELIVDAVLAKSQKEVNQIWELREGVEGFMHRAVAGNSPLFIYDVSVPLKYMEEYIANVENKMKQVFPNGDCYSVGHVGDGNLHFIMIPKVQGDKAVLHQQVNDIVYQQLSDFNGVVSAEHGIGLEKKAYLSISRNQNEMKLMKALKLALDPQNILGQGRIF